MPICHMYTRKQAPIHVHKHTHIHTYRHLWLLGKHYVNLSAQESLSSTGIAHRSLCGTIIAGQYTLSETLHI